MSPAQNLMDNMNKFTTEIESLPIVIQEPSKHFVKTYQKLLPKNLVELFHLKPDVSWIKKQLLGWINNNIKRISKTYIDPLEEEVIDCDEKIKNIESKCMKYCITLDSDLRQINLQHKKEKLLLEGMRKGDTYHMNEVYDHGNKFRNTKRKIKHHKKKLIKYYNEFKSTSNDPTVLIFNTTRTNVLAYKKHCETLKTKINELISNLSGVRDTVKASIEEAELSKEALDMYRDSVTKLDNMYDVTITYGKGTDDILSLTENLRICLDEIQIIKESVKDEVALVVESDLVQKIN